MMGRTSENILALVMGAGGFQIKDTSLNTKLSLYSDGGLTTTKYYGDGSALTGVVGSTSTTVYSIKVASATYLAANPSACLAGQYVSDISDSGGLTCRTPSGSGDVLLAATQTFTGANTFTSSITIRGIPSEAYSLTIDSDTNVSNGYVVSVATDGQVSILGTQTTTYFSNDYSYHAKTDLFVMFIAKITDAGSCQTSYEGYTDASAEPTTLIIGAKFISAQDFLSFTFPVKKGNYWRIHRTESGSCTINSTRLTIVPIGKPSSYY